jgi:hypothetical protein
MRKITFIVLLALLAITPLAAAQAQRYPDGYYDRNGQWHPYDERERSAATGYYDRNGVWHWYDDQRGGYYDRNGQWHPYDSRYDDGRVGRVGAPSRWTWSDSRGRSESLTTAARNLSLTAASLEREAYRRSADDDRAALDAVRRLNERAQHFARVAQPSNDRSNVVGAAYADLVDAYRFAQQRFGALEPDARLDNLYRVFSAAMGRLDRRYFGSRVFGGQNPANVGYGYDRYDGYYYDEYGNRLPRSARDTRPYRY